MSADPRLSWEAMEEAGAVGPDDPALHAVLVWWHEHQRHLPWRERRDRYSILVAEVMSQQTQVERVIEYWQRWIARWPDAETLARAELADVLRAWQGLGYPRRARALHQAAQQIVDHGWPQELTELPGVGPYTAAAIRCFADLSPELPLDLNLRRVIARRWPGGIEPEEQAWVLGQALMEFGQRLCRARAPLCQECPVRVGCFPADAAFGFDPAPRPARQAPYAGSLRQRRGNMLRAVLGGEVVKIADDQTAAESLLADGLAIEHQGLLVAS
jgi:A/G-specific adenine glycosylase